MHSRLISQQTLEGGSHANPEYTIGPEGAAHLAVSRMKEQVVIPEVGPPLQAAPTTAPPPAPGPTPPANGAAPSTAVSDYLEEVSKGSDGEENINNILQSANFDPEFSSRWKPYRVELVHNKRLDEEYDEKRQDLLIRGRKGHELEEEYGFTVQTPEGVAAVVTSGLPAREAEYNPLGYSRLGVYLSKHPDICIQHALLQHAHDQVVRLTVCKYIKGRTTTAIPRPATSAGFIEPTQGYDGHTSALRPGVGDPLQTQFDRSQVYLYEINKLLQPSSRPRQVLPLAVVTLTEDGAYVQAVDTKLVALKETLALSPSALGTVGTNPRLAHIIDAINARSAGSGNGEKGLLGSPTSGCSPDGLVGGGSSTPVSRGLRVIVGGSGSTSPDVSEAPSPKMGLSHHPHITLAQKLGGITGNGNGIPLLEQALASTNGLLNGHLAGLTSSSVNPRERAGLLMEGTHPGTLLAAENLRLNGDGGSSHYKGIPVDGEGNPQLALVISKINARLQTETKASPPAPADNPAIGVRHGTNTTTASNTRQIPAASQGDGLLPLPTSTSGLSLNNGNLISVNGSGGSGSSSLGSRPGSADSMVSGTGHTSTQCSGSAKHPAHLLTSANQGLGGLGFLASEGFNGDVTTPTSTSNSITPGGFGGMHKASMAAQLAAGLPVALGFSHGLRTGHHTTTHAAAAAAAAGLLGRKDIMHAGGGGGGGGGGNMCLDAYSQMVAASGVAGLYQSLHGQPLYADRLGHPTIAPPQPHATPTLTAPANNLHALHAHHPYQVLGVNMGFGALTATAPTTQLSAPPPHHHHHHHPHLNSLHQTTLALRPLSSPLKRSFPEASSALDWDKRPKFF